MRAFVGCGGGGGGGDASACNATTQSECCVEVGAERRDDNAPSTRPVLASLRAITKCIESIYFAEREFVAVETLTI
jgi:hypothetical protein